MSGAAVAQGWADSIRSFASDAPTLGATTAAATIEQQAAADTGGDSRLSNHASGSATVSVEGGDSEATAEADGSRAVWAILEDGTAAHVIRPRAGRYLMTPMGPRRMVHVRGVAARGTWSKGVAAGMVEAERELMAGWQGVS